MAITAMQNLANITASFEKYVHDTLEVVDGFAVQYPKVPFNYAEKQTWLAVNYIHNAPCNVFQCGDGSTNIPGSEFILLAQIGCFSRDKHLTSGAPVNRMTAYEMAAKVEGRLPLAKDINVYDYANGGSTVVGLLSVDNTYTVSFEAAKTTVTSSPVFEGITCLFTTMELRYATARAPADAVPTPGPAQAQSVLVNPDNGEEGIVTGTALLWDADPVATTYNVYFGSSYGPVFSAADVHDATFLATVTAPAVTYALSWTGLHALTWYYWRVDTVYAGNVIKGDVWCFRSS
jgi:hypothetical protein